VVGSWDFPGSGLSLGKGRFLELGVPGRLESFWVASVTVKVQVSRTESATSRIQRIPSPSPSKAAPKLKYSHVVESTL